VNDDLVIVGHPDQTSIEHPMCSAGKRKPVADRVWPAMLDGADVGRFSL
jgi:hypothetical protein